MKVKICGLTDPSDAAHAASHGADFAGIIFFAGSKRYVEIALAKQIAEAAKQDGAVPVAVFVDATADQMIDICNHTAIDHIQLHGPVSQSSLNRLLDEKGYTITYAMTVDLNGKLASHKELPSLVIPLYDTLSGGTGKAFDWKTFEPPTHSRWMLGGGLTPSNVKEAIAQLNPYGVDTASGVEFPGTNRKDPQLVKAFINEAKSYMGRKQ